MTDLLKERRASAKQRLEGLVKQLGEAEALVRDKACVYVTGSFGRGEASPYSDLDLFIVGLSLPAPGGEKQAESRALSRLDEVCVTADLIRQTREQKFPEFSVGGEYLAHHTAQELIGKLGTPEDDVLNTFTARLLLLLESKSLLGESVHAEVIRAAIGAYWRDYDGHESHFAPGFLANDILRLWRTFCVNYEARTQSEPAEKKAKRKLKNYKLKHSRLLTCYSALLYLLAVFTVKGTVSQESAVEMSALTPTERLERLPSLVESAFRRMWEGSSRAMRSSFARLMRPSPRCSFAFRIPSGSARMPSMLALWVTPCTSSYAMSATIRPSIECWSCESCCG